MPKAKTKKTVKTAKAPAELLTVRDFIRYAVSRFNEEELFYGHGTFTPYDEAVFLVLETLKLPIEQLEPYLDARLLGAEKQQIAALIDKRVKTRKPVPYLLKKCTCKARRFMWTSASSSRVHISRSFCSRM